MTKLNVNGTVREFEAEPDTPLLWVLREQLGLTGTKYGCGEGECGACTIIVDGRSVNSCLLFALDCDGRELTTIEGLAGDPRTQALQQAFVAHGAVQCGFCTPGMVVQATNLLATQPQADDATAKRAIEGNLCRCTGYQKIVDAIVDAGQKVAAGRAP